MDSFSPDLASPPVPEPPRDREQALWKPADLVLFLAFIPIAYVLAGFVALAGYSAFQPLAGWRLTTRALGHNVFFMLASELILYAFVLVYLYVLIVVHYRAPFWAALRWRALSGARTAQFLLGGILLAFAVAAAPTIFPERKTFPLEQMLSHPTSAYAVGIFGVVVAPFMEELVFRGVLFAFFERLAGLVFATMGTALLFGALHLQEYWGAWNHAFLIFMVGFVLSFTRAKTGSLVPSVLLHIAYNATLVTALFFSMQHLHAVR